MRYHCVPNGDRMVLVEFEEEISIELNSEVHRLARDVESRKVFGVEECIPSYRSLGIMYNPSLISFRKLENELQSLGSGLTDSPSFCPKRIEIPVCYGGKWGPDLGFVAAHNHLSPEEVIRIHCLKEYHVFLIGFVPGFPYLGELPPSIAAPRLSDPRNRVPAGSVAIGGCQTGIYPIETPGGWRIIGRTSLRLFDPSREVPFLLSAGDQVQFLPIPAEEEFDD